MARPTPGRLAAKRPKRKKQVRMPTGLPQYEETVGPPPVPGEPPPGPGGGGEPPPDHGIPGLPPDIANQLDGIIRQFGGGESAIRRAMQWLMTTSWFKQEYAGFDEGFAKGMFGDVMSGGLADYRAYKQGLQAHYRQFYGREATILDITSNISAGNSVQKVGQIGQGYTIAQANKGEWDYLAGAFSGGQLTEEEEKAYGEQQAGIETVFGQQVQNKVQAAMQRMQRVFQGTLGSSALGDQALGRRQQQRPDIQA